MKNRQEAYEPESKVPHEYNPSIDTPPQAPGQGAERFPKPAEPAAKGE